MQRRRARALSCLAAVVLLGAVLFVVAGQAVVSSQQYQLATVNSTLSSVVQSNQNLQLTRAELASPARILRISEQKLHMVVPAQVVYFAPVDPGAARGVTGTRRAAKR